MRHLLIGLTPLLLAALAQTPAPHGAVTDADDPLIVTAAGREIPTIVDEENALTWCSTAGTGAGRYMASATIQFAGSAVHAMLLADPLEAGPTPTLGSPQDAATAPATASSPATPRFTSLDIYIDSGDHPLAAYQFELLATGADVKIVGVEGGEHAAFREPPYYDPAALSRNRIIIAAFNTGKDLPKGKTRVARLHVQVTGGEPAYETKIEVAASTQGESVTARISFHPGEGQ